MNLSQFPSSSYTSLPHAHLPRALHNPPLALLLFTRHLMSDHTPWYEQWGSIRTHRPEVEPLQHGLLELRSAAWWNRGCQCCGVETPSLVQGTEYCWHGHPMQPCGEHSLHPTWGKHTTTASCITQPMSVSTIGFAAKFASKCKHIICTYRTSYTNADYMQNDNQYWKLDRDTDSSHLQKIDNPNIKWTYCVDLSQWTVVLMHKQVNNTSVTFQCC